MSAATNPRDGDPEVVQTVWAAYPPRIATMTRGSLIWPVISLICLVQTVLALFRDGWTVALSVVWLAVAVIAAGASAKIWRARVRMRPDGVEVRELHTTLYPWQDLVEIHNDGSSHAIVLRYRDQDVERVAFLPIPFKPGLFRRRLNPAFVDAPALIGAGWQRYAPLPDQTLPDQTLPDQTLPDKTSPDQS